MGKPKIQLPAQYDPYDVRLKATLNKNADAKNLIAYVRNTPTLICGAMRNGKPCRQPAGAGTVHTGYGRCKHHGGCSTGPKTEEGKAAASRNARTHGLYSSALTPEELELFTLLMDEPITDLSCEILMWKTKLLSYLTRAKDKGDIYAGSIENPHLGNALDTLRRMVETQQRIRREDEDTDIMDVINAELRAASKGVVHISWNSGAQSVTRERHTV